LKNTIKLFNESILSDSIDLVKQKEKEKYEAIIRERDKVIANLSHSIKNLIATVKDPLENLRTEAKEYTKTIDDAINGTNLIRGIVNAMNLSYVGSIEDFYEDAKSEDENKIAIKDIMINAIISAVPNMFDKKYFNDFQKRYFPTREIFIEATAEWQKVSQKKEPKEIIEYLNKYMFDIKLDFVNIDGLALSDKKGSVVKMMILLQEMILNAIKYSSFVDRDRRIVNIRLEKSDKIKFEIENRYKKDIVTKKSGLGHVIINNFAKLLKTEPLIMNSDDIFKIELNIPDLWR
jgi:two-component sensor histidine kinase